MLFFFEFPEEINRSIYFFKSSFAEQSQGLKIRYMWILITCFYALVYIYL